MLLKEELKSNMMAFGELYAIWHSVPLMPGSSVVHWVSECRYGCIVFHIYFNTVTLAQIEVRRKNYCGDILICVS